MEKGSYALLLLDGEEPSKEFILSFMKNASCIIATDGAAGYAVRTTGIDQEADPWHGQEGENRNDGGRGLYFDSPEGHNLEIITRPYGSGS